MTDGVINFPSDVDDDEMVWTCTNCDGQEFALLEDGSIECLACEGIQSRRHFDPDEDFS